MRQWPKSRTLVTPNVGKDVEQQELIFIAWENANDTLTLEDRLAVTYKTKLILILLSIKHVP